VSLSRRLTALQDQAMGQTVLPTSRKPPCRVIFGSRNAASEQDYARRGRPIRESFPEMRNRRWRKRDEKTSRTTSSASCTGMPNESAYRSSVRPVRRYTVEELSLDRTKTESAGRCQTKFHPPPRSVAIQDLGLHEIRKTLLRIARQAIFRSHSRRLPYSTGPPDRRVTSGWT
jgi:hypothetical protein